MTQITPTLLTPKEAVLSFFDSISTCIQGNRGEKVHIGMPGGTSLHGWFDALLTTSTDEHKQLLKECVFGLVDERCVDLDHDESNYKNLMQHLFQSLIERGDMEQRQIQPVYADMLEVAKVYDEMIGNFDIACYGLGPDGHIASLFPQSPLLDSESDTFLEIEENPKDEYDRISVSPNMIQKQKYKYLFVHGAKKQEAFENFFNPDINYLDCPAKLLLRGNGKLFVVISDVDSRFLEAKMA